MAHWLLMPRIRPQFCLSSSTRLCSVRDVTRRTSPNQRHSPRSTPPNTPAEPHATPVISPIVRDGYRGEAMTITRRQLLILLPAAAVAWDYILAGTPEASPNYNMAEHWWDARRHNQVHRLRKLRARLPAG